MRDRGFGICPIGFWALLHEGLHSSRAAKQPNGTLIDELINLRFFAQPSIAKRCADRLRWWSQ